MSGDGEAPADSLHLAVLVLDDLVRRAGRQLPFLVEASGLARDDERLRERIRVGHIPFGLCRGTVPGDCSRLGAAAWLGWLGHGKPLEKCTEIGRASCRERV